MYRSAFKFLSFQFNFQWWRELEISKKVHPENFEGFWFWQEEPWRSSHWGGGQDGRLLPRTIHKWQTHTCPQSVQRGNPQLFVANCGKPQVGGPQTMTHNWIITLNWFRFELTDPTAMNICRLFTESVQVEKLRYLFALPFLRYIFPEQTGWYKWREVLKLSKMIKLWWF